MGTFCNLRGENSAPYFGRSLIRRKKRKKRKSPINPCTKGGGSRAQKKKRASLRWEKKAALLPKEDPLDGKGKNTLVQKKRRVAGGRRGGTSASRDLLWKERREHT